jgi:hypothetical protein
MKPIFASAAVSGRKIDLPFARVYSASVSEKFLIFEDGEI